MLKFLRLPWRDKGRTLEALGCVLTARGLLLFVPFRRTAALTAYLADRFPARLPGDPAHLARLGYLVERVSRSVPGATCLTQALALKWMLTRRRVTCQLRIGVAKDADDAFKAHAWLESASQRVLIGGSTSPGTYRPLKLDLEKSR